MTKQEAIEILEEYKANYYNPLGWKGSPNKTKEAIDFLLTESKNTIDFNKLRDEFFAECTFDNYHLSEMNPRHLFEWFKKKVER